MTDHTLKEKLLQDIEGDADSYYSYGQRNHLFDLTCSAGSIVLSALASILAAAADPPRALGASVAAGLAGICATLQRVIDFRGRASWYFLMSARLRQLARALVYEDASTQEVSKRLGALEVEGEEQWGRMVQTGSTSPSTRTAGPASIGSGSGN